MVEQLRRWLANPAHICAHRNSARDFTRQRRLSFALTLLLVLQKTTQSIQVHLHEFFAALSPEAPLGTTPSGWTQARAKLQASAFVALNRQAVLAEFYHPDNPQLDWCGHRLLAVDGSEAWLPNAPEIGDCFGWQDACNQRDPCGAPYVLGRVSVLYDVQHRLVLDGILSRYAVGEIDPAAQPLSQTRAGDVLVCDRGYCGYAWLATLHQWGRDYVCRVPRQSFAAAQALFTAEVAGKSRQVWLEVPSGQRACLRALGLPLRLRVRLVTLRLATGELEVLVTSLLDEQKYPVAALAEAYGRRWGVETFYGLLKGCLSLENFSGRTVEAVFQDFQATLLLSNLESVLSREPPAELEAQRAPEQRPVVVNHAVSFHALKHHVVELLCRRDLPAEVVLDRLGALFRTNPVRQRPGRPVPRRPKNCRRSLNFWRSTRKAVF